MMKSIFNIYHLIFIRKLINSKYPILNNSSGYTLVELLAVSSIIVIVSGLIVGVLYSTLRGGNKTRVTNDVSQNGNYAMSIISNTALLAQAVTEVGGTPISDCTVPRQGSSIEFETEQGNLVKFICDPSTESIASMSGSLTNNLIDVNAVKVDPATCSFRCTQNNANPYSLPIIKIGFTVSQRSGSTFENIASSPFNTSVTMRNFNPR